MRSRCCASARPRVRCTSATSNNDVEDEPPLRKEDVELGLEVKEVHDVQKETEDVDECLEEALFLLAIVDIDEVM